MRSAGGVFHIKADRLKAGGLNLMMDSQSTGGLAAWSAKDSKTSFVMMMLFSA